jgi:hypothetical protein
MGDESMPEEQPMQLSNIQPSIKEKVVECGKTLISAVSAPDKDTANQITAGIEKNVEKAASEAILQKILPDYLSRGNMYEAKGSEAPLRSYGACIKSASNTQQTL